MISAHPFAIRIVSMGFVVALACIAVLALTAQDVPAPSPREKLLRGNGGNAVVEAAIASGLKWLARHQALDGRWSLDSFPDHGKCNCTGIGDTDDFAATGCSLLALLGAGETHKGMGRNNLYSHQVERSLKYLLVNQGLDGQLGHTMLGHGIATQALCEAYGITADPVFKRPAQKALDYLIAAQNADGSWSERRRDARRPIRDDSMMLASLVPLGELFPHPARDRDVFLLGWQMLALRSGTVAGLAIPNATYQKCGQFLDALASPDESRYAPVRGGSEMPASTACALMCRQLLGWGPRNPAIANGVEYLLKESPPDSLDSIRQGFHTTRVMFSMLPETWEKWHPKQRDLLIDRQDKGTNPDHRDQKGSWSPDKDAHGRTGGRLMVTSLSLLTLEVYYLPGARRGLGALKDEAIREAVK